MNKLYDYMTNRRSALSVTLDEPGPSRSQIADMVRIASRVPDHGKLAPWRFVVWSPDLRSRMRDDLLGLLDSMEDVDDVAKKRAATEKILHAPCLIAVVSRAAEHPKIPLWEQQLSAGAACMNLLIAANAMDFEAQWLTAWYVYEAEARDILRLQQGERIAGLIHVGSSNTPKVERPRPEADEILTFETD